MIIKGKCCLVFFFFPEASHTLLFDNRDIQKELNYIPVAWDIL